METADLQEFARILVVGAAALRGLAEQNGDLSPLIAESLEKVLEIAAALEAVGENLRVKLLS